MNDFLTTRQTQDILKVDRITIYRMLNDGRLKGNKMGQQWRFLRTDVENLLSGLKNDDSGKPSEDGNLPVHCLQTIQDLFSTVSEFSTVLIDLQGKPITETSNTCEYCRLFCSTPDTAGNCQVSRENFVQQAKSGQKSFTCHAGLQYAGTFVSSGNNPIGLFLVGGYKRNGVKADVWEKSFHKLIQTSRISEQKIQAAFQVIPVLTFEQENKLDTWAAATAQAFESILQERSAFTQRLQKIADLTQIS
jgi:excisionase family DNA binding protein